MNWLTWILLVLVLGGAAWVWYRIHTDKSGLSPAAAAASAPAPGSASW